jgi:pantoate--beta-alanine ligase
MLIFKKVTDLQHYLNKQQAIIGFVPTMGALHNGHISLIKESKQKCSITVCSIFVNPTQFNDKKDFEKYPITIEQDILQLELAGCDVLFLPTVDEIYPDGMAIKKDYELGFIETVFEGAKRPGHFNGVCMVVERLLHIVNPNMLFLGQKDYQQARLLQQMAEDLNVATDIVICPTVRESDGLAMSSRNRYLSPTERNNATCLYAALQHARSLLAAGENHVNVLTRGMMDILEQTPGVRIDYVEIRDAKTLAPLTLIEHPVVAALALFLGTTRLIDNMLLNP